jgi:TPR repeat protein
MAEEHCLLACEKGSKLALGMKYLFGWQTETDHKKAFEIFKQICEENDQNNEELSYSLFFFARCYHNGHGTEKCIKYAIKFYEKAIELGNSNAMFNRNFSFFFFYFFIFLFENYFF